MHERTARPLRCTVQAPQAAMPQPNLVPVRPSVSRIAHSSGMSGSTSSGGYSPLTVRVIAMEQYDAALAWLSVSIDTCDLDGSAAAAGVPTLGYLQLKASLNA